MARILDGKAVAAEVRAEVAEGVQELRSGGRTVRLDVVLVGDDPASATYVGGKEADAEEVGMASKVHRFPPVSPRSGSRSSWTISTTTRRSRGSSCSCRCRTGWTRSPCSQDKAG